MTGTQKDALILAAKAACNLIADLLKAGEVDPMKCKTLRTLMAAIVSAERKST